MSQNFRVFLYPSLQGNIACFYGIPHTKNSYVNQHLKQLDGLCVGCMVYHILFNLVGFSALQMDEMLWVKVDGH